MKPTSQRLQIFAVVTWPQVVKAHHLIAVSTDVSGEACAASHLCRHIGYYDDWQLMGEYRTLKQFLSICLSIQLLKIIKFTSQLIPKMGHMPEVLRICLTDMVFFSIVFAISILSFSMMLYLQLGSVVDAYIDQFPAFITLARALFFDVDIDEVLDNSSGYVNTLLLILYLFVAVFIMLSLFLSILAEGHSVVRQKEEERRGDPSYNEYGIVATAGKAIHSAGEAVVNWGLETLNPDDDSDDEHRPDLSSRGVADAERENGDAANADEKLLMAFRDDGKGRADVLREEVRQMGAAVSELAAAVQALKAAPRPVSAAPRAHRHALRRAHGRKPHGARHRRTLRRLWRSKVPIWPHRGPRRLHTPRRAHLRRDRDPLRARAGRGGQHR